MADDAITLAPRNDLDDLAARVARDGRAQARALLIEASAAATASLIERAADWRLTYNVGDSAYEATAEERSEAGAESMSVLISSLYQRARDGFQYLFEHDPISERIRRGDDPGPLGAIHRLLNASGFVDLLQRVTGVDAGPHAHVDAYVTRYTAGHFLTRHDDSFSRADRRAAYVIGLTRDWRPDWGGHLAFFDKRGDIEAAFVPSFNVLNVFRIPADHAVLPVAPFAGGARISISGWLRADRG